MVPKVAVATISGKAYFWIVNELKRRKITFVSVIPGEPIPIGVKAVITTFKEKDLVEHEKIIVYGPKKDLQVMGSNVIKILLGKEIFEKIVIGIDPGEVFGLAVIADGLITESGNFYSIKEVLNKIKSVLKTVNATITLISVKIGNGIPEHMALVKALDEKMPFEVKLEIVSEFGTNYYLRSNKHVRAYKHIISAIRIAERTGNCYSRRINN